MYNRKYVFIAACLGMLMFGIVMAVLGALLPSVITKYGLDKADAGSLFLLLTFGMLIGSLIFGPIVDRYGFKGMLVTCAALILGGFLGISAAPTTFWLKSSLFIIGFAGGVINGGTNTLVSDISTESRGSGLSYLGVFFGIGAFGIPFLLGTMLELFTYEVIIAGIGTLFLLPLIFFAVLNFPSPKQARGFPVREALGLTKESTLLLLGFILFIQSGLEMTVGGWAASFFNEELAVDASRAVLMLSLYWFGLMIARIVVGNLLKKVSAAFIFRTSLVIAFTGAMLMLSAQNPVVAVTGLVVLGIGFAAVFPVILGYVGDTYTKLSGTAFSVVFVIALTGGMLFPYLTGLIANLYGLRVALMIVPLGLTGAFIGFTIVHRRVKHKLQMVTPDVETQKVKVKSEK